MVKRNETERYLASPDTIYHLLDCSRDTLLDMEKQGKLREGVHFVRLGTQRRYVVQMMLDRMINLHDDQAHERAVMNWLASLPSNQQPSKRLPKVG